MAWEGFSISAAAFMWRHSSLEPWKALLKFVEWISPWPGSRWESSQMICRWLLDDFFKNCSTPATQWSTDSNGISCQFSPFSFLQPSVSLPGPIFSKIWRQVIDRYPCESMLNFMSIESKHSHSERSDHGHHHHQFVVRTQLFRLWRNIILDRCWSKCLI